MDNRPKFVMSPVTETPEVQAARAAHEKVTVKALKLFIDSSLIESHLLRHGQPQLQRQDKILIQ